MVDFLPWEEFDRRLKWRQGEHLTMVGPTGGGKTTLATHLLPRRDYIIVFATKKRDPLINRLKGNGYETITDADAIHKDVSRKFILAPPVSGVKSLGKQRSVFESALNTVFRQTGWTLFLDETRYICDYLGLAADCELLWQQGRSLGVTMVAGTQRPVKIPLFAYDQATHLFFWRDNDDHNLKRLGGLGGISRRTIIDAVSVLELHEVLYLNTRNGTLLRTIPPA